MPVTPPPPSPEVIEVPDSSPEEPAAKRRRAILAALSGDDTKKRKSDDADTKPETKPGTSTSSKRRMKGSMTRSRETERMLNSLGKQTNPITHSEAFARTRHVHSCSTGHQQRGGDRGFYTQARAVGLAEAARQNGGREMTYWDVRTKNVEDAARTKLTAAGCVIAINGPTGPRASNLQVQNMITANGGRYVPHQTSRCTHVVAERLSGTKSQKYINGQGSRGAAQRTRAVKVDWEEAE
ncbi:hypothetical protein A1Q2_02115 [Trichosporon asahii var. asahii CBS 8904]|uniref:BRCT domain-containing protein n=1 Tax=Trichosporon asahii var. asahii (strain CBS 8904) TaxID=1220162 RepID=K1VVN8_TRIAC|nr:hypothetical protein A1Q2_02115 [Trichosporon asahii var. asahii CBS 8904]